MLVVDDEEGIRLALWAVFHSLYELDLCRNSAEAMKAVEAHRISVAIIDIKMEGESGLDLLKRIKATDPLVEVIVLTGYETLEAAKTALRHQASDLLSKPFDIATISEAVSRALKKRMAAEVAHRAIARMNGGGAGAVSRHEGALHDVRGVMAAVGAISEACSEIVGRRGPLRPADVSELRRNRAAVCRYATLAGELCGRYLGAGRAPSGPAAPRDIRPLLSDLCQLLRSHPGAKGAQIRFLARPGAEFRAEAEPVEVFQMVFNLALNGLQAATGRRRLAIEVRTVKAPVNPNMLHDTATTRVLRAPGFANRPPLLAISVRDSGAGIAAPVLERMFSPFPAAGPAGVGMSVVAQLIAKNAGLLFIETAAGRGTTASVYLPQST